MYIPPFSSQSTLLPSELKLEKDKNSNSNKKILVDKTSVIGQESLDSVTESFKEISLKTESGSLQKVEDQKGKQTIVINNSGKEESASSFGELPSEVLAHIFSFAGLSVSTIDLYRKDPTIKEMVYSELFQTLGRCDDPVPFYLKESYQAESYQVKILSTLKLLKNEAAKYPGGQEKIKEIRKQDKSIYSPQGLRELNRWIQEKKDAGLIAFCKALPKDLIPLKTNLGTDQQTSVQLASEIRRWLFSNKEKLEKVVELNLVGRDLTVLPPEIKYFKNLSRLWLMSNKLTSLPSEVVKLTKLKELNLTCNKLTNFSSEIGKLVNLADLCLSGNELTNLPPEIGKLVNLVRLYFDENQLTSLPAEIGNLTQLEVLALRFNKLTSLPPEIGNLIQLTGLFLSDNKLTSFPSEVGKLTKLKMLCLERNELTSLPPEIGKLVNLIGLYVEENKLTSLPSEIGNLTQLNRLSLDDNPLLMLPITMRRLTQLLKETFLV